MKSSTMFQYSVWDDQFHLFSEPFLAVDDNAAERTVVQTAIYSEGFRKWLGSYSLYCIGSFDPTLECPAKVLKHPRLVSGSVRLLKLVDVIERKQKEHLASVSASDSEVKEDFSDENLQCIDPT